MTTAAPRSPAAGPPAADRVPPAGPLPESHWRSLFFFVVYRLIVAGILLATVGLFGASLVAGAHDHRLYLIVGSVYVAFSLACVVPVRVRRPAFGLQVSLQVSADVVFIVLLMHASGGIASGLGLLLLPALAAASLVSRGRLALFHAALASIAVLLQHTLQVLSHDVGAQQYVQAGLLSAAFFATAWLAHTLAKYALGAEQLAAQRGVDLANLSQINQLVIRDMQDGVIVIDGAGNVLSLNGRAQALLGAPPGRVPFMLEEYSEQLHGRYATWSRQTGPGDSPVDTLHVGRSVAARFVAVGLRRDTGAVVFLEDLTRVQAQARQMKLASLGRLTANIAHEIRNPLSAISHATELLQEEPGMKDPARRLLHIIRENTQRLDRMVQDVLRLNRRDRAHSEVFLLRSYITTFVGQFCEIEKIARETFAEDVDPRLRVRFDQSHLNQVMWNLSRNALRHCSRGAGSIRLNGVSTPAGTVRLTIEDDGSGVAPEFRAQLFEPFFTTSATGTGLGLYIAREVCEANDATLEYVETVRGCRFTIVCKGA